MGSQAPVYLPGRPADAGPRPAVPSAPRSAPSDRPLGPRRPGTDPATGNAPGPDRAPFPATPPPLRARPQAQNPRARVAAAAGRGGLSAAAVPDPRCGPSNCRRCGAKEHTKGTFVPFSRGAAKHPRTPKLRSPRREHPRKKIPRPPPSPVAGAAGSPGGRCPRLHNNFETSGQGTGTERCPLKEEMGMGGGRCMSSAKCTFQVAPRSPGRAQDPPPAPRRAARVPAPSRRPPGRGRAPASAPRGAGRALHSPRPGCAPRGPAPSPINGML